MGFTSGVLLLSSGEAGAAVGGTVGVATGVPPGSPPGAAGPQANAANTNTAKAHNKLRHLVENGFLELKQWRGVATRYAKRTSSYLAICQLRALMIWSKLF